MEKELAKAVADIRAKNLAATALTQTDLLKLILLALAGEKVEDA